MDKTKDQVVAEFRQAEILEAARKVFARRGYSQATVDEIAAAAGLAKGTLYQYFPSKQEIYFEALRRSVDCLRAEVDRGMAAIEDTRGKVHAFVLTRLSFFEANRDFFKIFHSEFGNIFTHPAGLQRDLRDLYVGQAESLRAALEAGVRRGEIRDVPAAALAFLIYDTTRGLVARRLLGWGEGDLESEAQVIVDLIWEGIRQP